MRLITGFILFVLASANAFADHHALNLEARQPRTEMNITSINLGEDLSVITAEGRHGWLWQGVYYLSFNIQQRRIGVDSIQGKDGATSMRIQWLLVLFLVFGLGTAT